MELGPLVQAAEGCLHGHAPAHLLGVAVGHLQEGAAASLQVHHRPRDGRVQVFVGIEVVEGEGEDGAPPRQLHLLEAVAGAALAADAGDGILDDAAGQAAGAVPAQLHRHVPPVGDGGGVDAGLWAPGQVAQGGEGAVAGQVALGGQILAQRPPPLRAGQGLPHLQHQGVGAIAVVGQQQPVALLRLLQGAGQHQQGVGGAGVAHRQQQRVLDLGAVKAELTGHLGGAAQVGGVEGGPGHLRRPQACLLQGGATGLDGGAHVAVFRLQLGLEGADVAVLGAAPGAHHLAHHRGQGEHRHRRLGVHQHGGGSVAHQLLPGRLGLPRSGVGGQHQHPPGRAALDGVQRGPQGHGGGAGGAGEVGGVNLRAQVQGQGSDAGALLLQVGGGGGAEEEGVHRGGVGAHQRLQPRLHGHGQAVLVAVGHRPLAGEGGDAPGLAHLGAGQAVEGHVDAIGEDPCLQGVPPAG